MNGDAIYRIVSLEERLKALADAFAEYKITQQRALLLEASKADIHFEKLNGEQARTEKTQAIMEATFVRQDVYYPWRDGVNHSISQTAGKAAGWAGALGLLISILALLSKFLP